MKRKFIHLILAFAASCMSLFAQGVTVTLTTDTGMSRPAGISKAEQNLGIVLSEINAACSADRTLQTKDLPMDQFAIESLTMLWANLKFYCDDSEVVERLWVFEGNRCMQVNHIPLMIKNPEKPGTEVYQEAVVEFDLQGKITDFRFAIDAQTSESMENCGETATKEQQMQILQFVERFRTAYNTKDLAFMKQVFSDDALIITGKVVTTRSTDMQPVSKVSYTKQTKQQYMNNLAICFKRNKWIDVKFSNIGENGEQGGCAGITKTVKNGKEFFGVRLRQEWRSANYSDEGYVFLLWEFPENGSPIIHVRTWQPEWVGGEKLAEEDIFSLSDFEEALGSM